MYVMGTRAWCEEMCACMRVHVYVRCVRAVVRECVCVCGCIMLLLSCILTHIISSFLSFLLPQVQWTSTPKALAALGVAARPTEGMLLNISVYIQSIFSVKVSR